MRYGFALLVLAAALALTVLARLFFSLNPTPVLLLALVGAAWYAGRVPGILVAVLIDLSIDLLFDDTPYQLGNFGAHFARLLVLTVVAILASSRGYAERRLKTRARQQAAVAKLGQSALGALPMSALLPMASEVTRETLEADFASICLPVDKEPEMLCFASVSGLDQRIIGQKFDLRNDSSFARQVIEIGEAATSDLTKEVKFQASAIIRKEDARGAAGVRIMHRDGLYGVLGAFSRTRREFTEDDLNFLRAIANVVAEAAARLKAEEATREQRSWLKTTLSSIGDGVIATDSSGNVSFMNPVAERLTDWTEADAIGRKLGDIFHVANELTGEAVLNPVERVLESGSVVALANHSVLTRRDGKQVPIADTAAPIKDGDDVRGVVLVFSDVTEQRMAEKARREAEIMQRIVDAQESERQRIARDLHDHLGQQMTGLRIDVEMLMEKCGDNADMADALEHVQEAAQMIDRDIGFLSWELRPTELENLGLVNALGSFVREWSGQYGIAADFQAHIDTGQDGNGRAPMLVETNLYRIAQEGLNNILKHAHAGKVNLLLHHRKDHLTMIIEDDGQGFDPDSTAGAGPRGLGLAGMRERTALLNGSLEIESEPGQGTTVIARIPLEQRSENQVV